MITAERRRELVDTHITLNGKPALVCGYRNAFATVVDLVSRLQCEFAWETVDDIITNRNGEFRS